MNQLAKVSIVMPTYNVEKYIGDAIESIIGQTYSHWELIIVDDCSNDNTTSIIEEYIKHNSNITLIKRKGNSGGCRLPRFDGIMASNGDFVCPIDSDDTIEKEYLEKLIKRQIGTSSDIVLSRIIYCDDNLRPKGATIPKSSYDMNITMTGEEACKKTINGWDISMNGLIAKTSLYKDYIKREYDSNFNKSFSDEVDHRKILLCAKKVSITDAHYFYRQQPSSIIHTTSVNYYDVLIANKYLLDFITSTFKNDKILLTNMYDEYIEKVYRAQQKYYANIDKYSPKEKVHITNLIYNSHSYIKNFKPNFGTNRNKILSLSYCLFKFYTRLVISIAKLKSKLCHS